jgi:hypothetical protein
MPMFEIYLIPRFPYDSENTRKDRWVLAVEGVVAATIVANAVSSRPHYSAYMLCVITYL